MKTIWMKEQKKSKLFLNFFLKKQCLKQMHMNMKFQEKMESNMCMGSNAFLLLTKFNRNSASTRLKNSCLLTSRSKSIETKFKLSRISLRKLISHGFVSGLHSASW